MVTGDIDRLGCESDLDYHKRLILGKVVDKSLADIDYSELSDAVYGQRYSSDVARRMMYGSAKTLQLMEACSLAQPAPNTSPVSSNAVELQKERVRLSDQRREFNRAVAEMARVEHIADRLVNAAVRVNEMTPLSDDIVEYAEPEENEAILVLCDWHYGMKADNVWNRYDTEVCRQRVQSVIKAAAQRLILHNVEKLNIVVLGDMIHGAIHTSSRVASEELVSDQLMQVSELLAQSIAYLSKYVADTYVYVTYGNHARVVQNKKDSIHRDNMERLIPWWLKSRLSDCQSIHVMSFGDDEFVILDICGYGVCATHGDLDKIWKSVKTLPVLFQRKYNRKIDYILLADRHHREELDDCGVCAMISGSLCGTDEYANGKRLYANPEQLLLIFAPDIGVDATYHLKC